MNANETTNYQSEKSERGCIKALYGLQQRIKPIQYSKLYDVQLPLA